ncbi:uncharacterized protein METZ01_LOCUS219792 [marine metagenome]|uniref:Uncharacterized protein n=1 Tax=marine metagenome TaxID=408172 RepID=A0A382FV66_9ZZZZ
MKLKVLIFTIDEKYLKALVCFFRKNEATTTSNL